MWSWKVFLGAAIVLFAVREMFHDIFHPSQSGALSDFVARRLFRLLRRWPSLLADAGPLAVVFVIFAWALLLATGFALIYWAAFPAHFSLRTANVPSRWNGFWWSLYYSLEMLTTLGLGDIQPNPNWLRLLSAFHTLAGFSFLTASITWVVLLFPALGRARTLARRTAILAEAQSVTGAHAIAPEMHLAIGAIAEELVRTRVDLFHFPILFYFYAEDPRASLPGAIVHLERFAAEGSEPQQTDALRLAATTLRIALDDLAELICERIVDVQDRSPSSVFRAFAELHIEDRRRRAAT